MVIDPSPFWQYGPIGVGIVALAIAFWRVGLLLVTEMHNRTKDARDDLIEERKSRQTHEKEITTVLTAISTSLAAIIQKLDDHDCCDEVRKQLEDTKRLLTERINK